MCFTIPVTSEMCSGTEIRKTMIKVAKPPKYHLCLHCNVYSKNQLYDLWHLRLKDK